jgi:hypothetical protein
MLAGYPLGEKNKTRNLRNRRAIILVLCFVDVG